jgi:signal transduction histidine kinase
MDPRWQMFAWAMPFFLAGGVAFALILSTWRFRSQQTVHLFQVTMFLVGLWPVTVGLELISTDTQLKFNLLQGRTFIMLFAGLTHFLLCLDIAGIWKAQRQKITIALFALCVLVLSLNLAPAEWGGFEVNLRLAPTFPHRALMDDGALRVAFRLVLNAFLLGGLAIMATRWKERNAAYLWAILALLLGQSIPVLIDFLFRHGITPWEGMNCSSLGVVGSCAAWAWVVWRCGILNLLLLSRAEITEQLTELLFIVDSGGRLADCNRSAILRLGGRKQDWIGRGVASLPAPWETILTAGEAGQIPIGERVFDRTHSDVWSPTGALAGRIVMLHDVTETVRMKRQMLESHRMEVVGRMAGGIAHEFNNLLTVILGYVDVLSHSESLDSGAQVCLDSIRHSGERAAALTQQLLSFSQKQRLQPVLLDVNAVVEGMAAMLGQAVGRKVAISFELKPGLGTVKVDRAQLEHVLLEVASNARDAMRDGGSLIIRTRGNGNGRVCIEVEDNGPGVDESIRDRVFEPFFTTGHPSQRSGLGLSMVHGFVTQTGGSIVIERGQQGGALVRMEFPCST